MRLFFNPAQPRQALQLEKASRLKRLLLGILVLLSSSFALGKEGESSLQSLRSAAARSPSFAASETKPPASKPLSAKTPAQITSSPSAKNNRLLFRESPGAQRVGPMLFRSSFRARISADSNPWWREYSTGGFSDAAPFLQLEISPSSTASFSPWKGLHIGAQVRSSFQTATGTVASSPTSVLVEPLFFQGDAGAGISYRADHWFKLKILGRVGAAANASDSWRLNNGLVFPLLDAALQERSIQRQMSTSFVASVSFDFLLLLELQYEAKMFGAEQRSHFSLRAPSQWWLLPWNFRSSSSESNPLDVLEQRGHHLKGRLGLGMFRLEEAGPFHLFAAAEARLGQFRSDGFFAAGHLGVDARIRPWTVDFRVGLDDQSTLLARATLRCERTSACVDVGVYREVLFFENDLLSHHASVQGFIRHGAFTLEVSLVAGVAQSLRNTLSTWDAPQLHSALQVTGDFSLGPMIYRLGTRVRSFHSTTDLSSGRIQGLLFFEAQLGKDSGPFLASTQLEGRKEVVP